MKNEFAKPQLTGEQKRRIKDLYRRNNYRGFLAIGVSIFWISAAAMAAIASDLWLYPLSIIIIGTRQRAIASLLHEAAHGTLFSARWLNALVGRIICGWPILQSFSAYRTSHVLTHHPHVGDSRRDPDFQYMLEAGVYESQSRAGFLWRFMVLPWFGFLIPSYIRFLLKDRLGTALRHADTRREALALLLFHAALGMCAYKLEALSELVLLWWVPFLLVQPIVGWFSELSEHYPMMQSGQGAPVFYSRNRYAGPLERMFIGMHCDHLHLTHHLLPGIPHWNLKAATAVLREDPAFRAWDDCWGGIFSSAGRKRVSFMAYVVDIHEFRSALNHPFLSCTTESA
jgi:fatty acid desaturase